MISIESARRYYRNDSAHDFDHVLRVLSNAMKIAQTEFADIEILQTAVLLHDVARDEQRRTGVDHAAAGAVQARKILAGKPPVFVNAVCHAIETHRFRIENPPQTLEAKILYDADKLDSIGAIGVARAFAYGGSLNQRLWADDETDGYSARQELEFKLVRVKDTLLTTAAKKMAQKRHTYMISFFERLAAEVKGDC